MSLTPVERAELLSFLPSSIKSSEDLESWIKGAEVRVSREYFEESYIYALSLMVAHKATLSGMASEGVAGPITSKREGDIEVNYGGGGSGSNGDLGLTTYGMEYKQLAAQYKVSPGLTRGMCFRGLDGGDRIQSVF